MKMKKFALWLLIPLFLAGCSLPCRPGAVTQTSTIDALLAGVYDGEMTLRELLRHGDFGIGTFDRLDGEMVVLDGTVYQVRADGAVYRPGPEIKTPFAAVTFFQADKVLPLKGKSDYPQLQKLLDNHIANPHLFYAFRIAGRFSKMHTRSVPAQDKPYPPLAQVTKNQPEFRMSDVSGTIVGFRCPVYVKGINVPGYHLHFISDDRRSGGHILGFELENGQAEIGVCHQLVLIMPRGSDDLKTLDLSLDRSEELEQVEK